MKIRLHILAIIALCTAAPAAQNDWSVQVRNPSNTPTATVITQTGANWGLLLSNPNATNSVNPSDQGFPDLVALDATLAYNAATDTFGLSAAVTAQLNNAVSTGGSYANPPWLTQLAYSKLTGAPTSNTAFTNGANYTTLSQVLSSIALTTTGSGAASYNSTTGVINVPTPVIPAAVTLTTTGTSGAATFNPTTGALNIPNYAPGTGTVTGVTAGTGLAGGTITTSGTISLPNTGTPGTYGAVTTDAQGRVTSGKRVETYTVTTNASGVASVTFGTAFGAAPNIQLQATNFTSDNQFARVTAISTTGFSVIARLRTDVAGLLPTFSNINAATIDVLITEK